MEQNPIKYSDLISPDDSLEKLVNQLTTVNQTYSELASNIRRQAASVAESLNKISGATEEGRKRTKGASEDAERLERAYKQLDAALSENAKEIARLNQIKREANNYNKQLVRLNGEEVKTREDIARASYEQLSAQYSLNKAFINSLNAEDRLVKENKELIDTTKDIYEQMKRLQEATGKHQLNVGNYESAITSSIGVNTRWYQGMQDLATLFEGGFANGIKAAGAAVQAFGKKLLALMMNPIVATIAAIAAAFMALAKGISTSEENTMALQRVLAPFQRILTGVVSVLQDVAGWLLKGVEGMEKLAMGASRLMERLPLVGSAFKKVNDSLQENIELTRRKQELDKNMRLMNERIAQSELNVSKFRSDAAKTDDPARRVLLNKMAIREEERIMQERLKLAKEDYEIKKAKAEQSQNDKQANDELSASYVTLLRVQKEYYDRTLRMQKQVTTNEAKLNKSAGGGDTGKKDTSAEDAARKELEVQRKIDDAKIALIDDELNRERATIIASYDRQIEDIRAKYGEQTELIELLEQQKAVKLAELVEKSAKQQEDAQKKAEDARLKAIKEGEQQREQAVRDAERRINSEYELSMSYAELEENENKKTQMRLQAEKERLQKLIALYQQDGKVLTETELAVIKNNIAQIDKELAKNKKDKDIYDLMGFSFNDEQKQALNDAFAMATEQLSNYMQAYVEAAEKRLEYAEKEVEKTKSALDAEIEARNNGYAANVALAQKEYDNAKKNQQKALQEQKRAQKAQQMIDTATQVSSLITATANIWKAFSSGGPWGIAAAIAATALMFGSFAAAKIKAASVSGMGTGEEEYGEGTVELLEGGSHQSGNDIDLGRKRNGVRRRAEGGEFFAVINKRNSRRYRSVIPEVIGSLNDGTFAQKYQRAYEGGSMNVNVQTRSEELVRLSDDVRSIREQGERNRYVDGNGNTVETYKNLRRIIRNH